MIPSEEDIDVNEEKLRVENSNGDDMTLKAVHLTKVLMFLLKYSRVHQVLLDPCIMLIQIVLIFKVLQRKEAPGSEWINFWD